MINNDSDRVTKRLLSGFLPYLLLFAGLFILYVLLSPFVSLYGSADKPFIASDVYKSDLTVRLCMAVLLFMLLVTMIISWMRDTLTSAKLVCLLISAGFVLRFGTMLYTPFFVHGHDVSTFDGYGHLSYIYRLFELKGLPDSIRGQYYHPPFAHLAEAAVVRLFAFLTGETDRDTIFEAARLVPAFASCALLIVCTRLFDALNFKSRAKVIALAVIAFHPSFLLLSSSINNDMLSIFFTITAFLCTIRWYQAPTYKNILLLALSIGCAMSTKFSGVLIALFTGAIFFLVFIRRRRELGTLHLTAQFGAFSLICFPLGLWYHLRNLWLFGQPLGYVAQLSNNSTLYIGDKSIAERLLTFSLHDVLTNVFCSPWNDFRLWEYTVKCALFGEFTFSDKHKTVAALLLASSLFLIILSLGSMLWFTIIDRKRHRLAAPAFTSLWLLLMLSFVFFNLRYPFGCTMDFRYIVPTVITGAAFLGMLYDRFTERNNNVLTGVIVAILAVFCALSAAFFIL